MRRRSMSRRWFKVPLESNASFVTTVIEATVLVATGFQGINKDNDAFLSIDGQCVLLVANGLKAINKHTITRFTLPLIRTDISHS